MTMHDHEIATSSAPKRTPWNKGKLTGAKPPLRPKHVWSIRTRLQVEGRTRDLAMFNLAIDSKLRGCDVVALKVEVRQNKTESLKWYHLAAERGNDGAQFSVGLLYFAGVAVPENRVEAAKWWRRAADQGHIGAQAYLGLSYATSLGVP